MTDLREAPASIEMLGKSLRTPAVRVDVNMAFVIRDFLEQPSTL